MLLTHQLKRVKANLVVQGAVIENVVVHDFVEQLPCGLRQAADAVSSLFDNFCTQRVVS